MRKYLKIIIFAGLVPVVFAAGMITEAIRGESAPVVTVVLKNDSKQRIDSVQLNHEHGTVSIGSIEAGDNRTIAFHSPGESSYKLEVRFQNGNTITGGAGYVEAGYVVTESISEAGIKPEHYYDIEAS